MLALLYTKAWCAQHRVWFDPCSSIVPGAPRSAFDANQASYGKGKRVGSGAAILAPLQCWVETMLFKARAKLPQHSVITNLKEAIVLLGTANIGWDLDGGPARTRVGTASITLRSMFNGWDLDGGPARIRVGTASITLRSMFNGWGLDADPSRIHRGSTGMSLGMDPNMDPSRRLYIILIEDGMDGSIRRIHRGATEPFALLGFYGARFVVL